MYSSFNKELTEALLWIRNPARTLNMKSFVKINGPNFMRKTAVPNFYNLMSLTLTPTMPYTETVLLKNMTWFSYESLKKSFLHSRWSELYQCIGIFYLKRIRVLFAGPNHWLYMTTVLSDPSPPAFQTRSTRRIQEAEIPLTSIEK